MSGGDLTVPLGPLPTLEYSDRLLGPGAPLAAGEVMKLEETPGRVVPAREPQEPGSGEQPIQDPIPSRPPAEEPAKEPPAEDPPEPGDPAPMREPPPKLAD